MYFLSETIRTVRLALKALMLHKLRSGLTMLGIVFGVFSVIAMLAIGEGASYQAQQQVLALGATNIIVLSIKPPNDSQSTGGGGMRSGITALTYGLLRSDYRLLTETLPTIDGAMPIREIPSEARYLRKMLNVRLVGCTHEYMDLNRLEMQQGRFLTDRDQDEIANVCVLAAETARELFPFSDPLNEPVLVRGARYKVVGVTRERTASAAVGGSLSGQEFNKDVYIPLRTLQSRVGDRIINRLSGSFSVEQVELNQITLKVRDLKDVLPTSEVVRESLTRTHPFKKDWDVVVPLELLRQADQIRQIFNIVLGSIAAISLVVGGIGIMNIMLATVTERTRRSASAARRRRLVSGTSFTSFSPRPWCSRGQRRDRRVPGTAHAVDVLGNSMGRSEYGA
ncbi:MAG: ABC transporter permease [Planctomycetaceae bacterium]